MQVVNKKTGQSIKIIFLGDTHGYRERVYLGLALAKDCDRFGQQSVFEAKYDPHFDSWKLFAWGIIRIKVKLEASDSLSEIDKLGWEYIEE